MQRPHRTINNEKMITSGGYLRIWEAYVVYFIALASQNIIHISFKLPELYAENTT
jgi:hypothetical protein